MRAGVVLRIEKRRAVRSLVKRIQAVIRNLIEKTFFNCVIFLRIFFITRRAISHKISSMGVETNPIYDKSIQINMLFIKLDTSRLNDYA
jgi:hypothetical protein